MVPTQEALLIAAIEESWELNKDVEDDLVQEISINPAYPEQTIKVNRVPRKYVEHSLNILPTHKPFAQKKRSLAAERSLTACNEVDKFFKANILREKDFQWNSEAEGALLDLKQHLASLPALAAPQEGEVITVNLSAGREAISSVLIVECDKVQVPIYFISRALREAELNYMPIDKLILALVHTTKRLRRYILAHQVKVVKDKPIRSILEIPKIVGRLAKWGSGFGEHNIAYKPQKAIKAQVLADFLTKTPEEPMEVNDLEEGEPTIPLGKWTLYTDRAWSIEGSGAGLIITDPQGTEYTYSLRLEFPCTNNEVEYEALIAGLHLGKLMKIQEPNALVDPRLVESQVNKEFVV
ncbi:uncharacterized protein LOC143597010 [Bidens hawaiensis]|uniref:uncharacterized protein LOC143597010 n=1 Tax=Bidens hawaiensis TaxID=980011 RepID=UPI0040490065